MTNEDQKNQKLYVAGFEDGTGEIRILPYTLHPNLYTCKELSLNPDMRKYLAAAYTDVDIVYYSVLLTELIELTPISKYTSPLHRPEEAGE